MKGLQGYGMAPAERYWGTDEKGVSRSPKGALQILGPVLQTGLSSPYVFLFRFNSLIWPRDNRLILQFSLSELDICVNQTN